MWRRLSVTSCRHAAVQAASLSATTTPSSFAVTTTFAWRQQRGLAAVSAATPLPNEGSAGLFGVRGLLVPADFKIFTDRAIRRCNSLRGLIKSRDAVTSTTRVEYVLETLSLLDEVSNEICSVIDAAELCRNVHTDKKFVDASIDAFNGLSSYIHYLNSDTTLYLKLRDITDHEAIMEQLPEESRIFARDLRNEFESDGIHLDDSDKQRALRLQSSIIRNETLFVQNVSRADEAENEVFLLGPFGTGGSSQYSQIASWLGGHLPQTLQTGEAPPPMHVVCSSSKRVVNPLLRSLDDEHLRRQLWLSSTDVPAVNAKVLGSLIKERQELAKLLGFESFSHKYLANKVMRTPAEVQSFIQRTSDALRSKASAEVAVLADLKRQISGGERCLDIALQPWDVAYLSNKHRAATAQRGGSQGSSALRDISSYLGVEDVIEGLAFVSKEVFGIAVEVEAMAAAENWLFQSPGSSDSPSKYARVVKLRVRDASTAASLGTVYIDLYNRKGKFPGSAHFTVQCGCKTGRAASSGGAGGYQEPIIALVFNFMPQPALPASCMPVLSLNELEVLYHEWGHALHSLLSRTTYQHLSGTRGAADFVEVPSHLLEHFARLPSHTRPSSPPNSAYHAAAHSSNALARTPEVVNLWARNSVTKMRVPSGLLEEALHAKSSFGALELQTQLLYSAADQHCFGTAMGDLQGCDATEVYYRARSGVAALQSSLTDIPLPFDYESHNKAGMCLLSHSHFVNYGGGYYSYLFARMHAAQIWHHCFAARPLALESGLFIRDRVLRFGAARDTRDMLTAAGGGDLDPRHFLETI